MRRDVFIDNDSGALSVVAADALDAIVNDGRSDDELFVKNFKALLLELYGDDSMPVRIVVNEPLTSDEEAQWLARATWRLDTADGRLLVMGGFDPDVMVSWKQATGGEVDGHGVGVIDAKPGAWRVDVYAHVGSMNGRAILDAAHEKTGAAFRRSHRDRAFPLWLARTLEFSAEDDPGHEELWNNIAGNIASGALRVDLDSGDPIGFLVHLTPFVGPVGDAPAGGWFERTTNARTLGSFPLGVRSDVPDPNLRSFADRLLGRKPAAVERPAATEVVEVIEVWTGDPLKKIAGDTPLEIYPTQMFHLYWLAALCADSPPRFELWVNAKGWPRPTPTADFAVVQKSGGIAALGPSRNLVGWELWWAAREVSILLNELPVGTELDFATAPRLDYNSELNPAVGRTLYSGVVVGEKFQIREMSPPVGRAALDDALEFIRGVVRTTILGGDERSILMDATTEFRQRFSALWPVDE
jgi:hypothetical protein